MTNTNLIRERLKQGNVSESTKRRNPDLFGAPKLCPAEPKSDHGNALDDVKPRKVQGIRTPARNVANRGRARISFRVWSMRPADWDNQCLKYLQDGLVKAGLIPGDDWHQLEGSVVSEKAATEEEERTEITIDPPQI